MPPLLFSSSSPKRVLFFVFFSCRELPFNLLLFFKNKTIWCNQPNRIWTHHCKMQNEKPACLLLLLCFSLKLDLCCILPQKAMHCGVLSPTGCEIFLCCWTCLCALQSWLLETGLSMNTAHYMCYLQWLHPAVSVLPAENKHLTKREN